MSRRTVCCNKVIESTLKMKKKLLLLFLLSHWMLSSGQNLVPNPSFEELNNCPTSSGLLVNATSWINPNLKSPDLYHACAGSDCDGPPFVCVPDNWTGSQTPFTGDGYAGIFVGGENVSREYIQVPLLNTLSEGQKYILTYHLSLADDYQFAIDRMGAYFSTSAVADEGLLNFSPQMITPADLFLTNKGGWTEITDTLIASGGEAFLTIGNFNDEANTNFMGNQGGGRPGSYYYIDEVKLVLDVQDLRIEGDTSICPGDSTVLTASADTEYKWTDQRNKQLILSRDSFLVVAPTVTTTYEVSGFAGTTSITVEVKQAPIVNLGKDTTLCEAESLSLEVTSDQTTYLWQDGSVSPTYTIRQEGIYWVELENDCGTRSDTLLVEYETCECAIYFPTVFSPNNDGVNDNFRPFFECRFEAYEFMIFDRWGARIFASNNPDDSWDGRYRGREMPTGVYLYHLKFSSTETNKTMEFGEFTLLR